LEQRFGEMGEEVRTGAALLDQLQTERAALQTQQLEALQLAESKRKEAAAAESVVAQLQNPFTPRNILQWFIDHTPRLLAILAGMFLLRWATRFFSRRIVRIMTRSGARGSREEREDRAKTLMGVVHSAASLAIVGGGIVMACDEIGIAVTPLVGGAAVVGLAVAFGAQNLIRDYFYGFTILLENQYKINDVVKIGDTSGQVERITLRITVLRDLEGRVHFIPNGKIDSVTNMTHGWSRALFEIAVAYKEDADDVMGVLLELARELRVDPQFGPLILDEPEMLGVDSFGESSVNIKFILKTRPLKQWSVKRELLRRIKRRFDELGIEIPFPHRTVYHRGEESGERSMGQPQSGEDQIAWAARKSA
jgi:small conductance mechanosensitive channel